MFGHHPITILQCPSVIINDQMLNKFADLFLSLHTWIKSEFNENNTIPENNNKLTFLPFAYII